MSYLAFVSSTLSLRHSVFNAPPRSIRSLFDGVWTESRAARRASNIAQTEHTAMPSKISHEDGVKGKGRSKSDKARRSFELNGQYSSKHLRLKESAREAKCLQAREVK